MLPSLAAGCGPRRQEPILFQPLRYDYLTPIPLNVASLEIQQRFVPSGGAADVSAQAPVSPAQALRRMAEDRLQALGPAGRAVFVINDATLIRRGGNYLATLAVELDIYTADNQRTGFAEARVARRQEIEDEDSRAELYEMVRVLMETMNVEFEYQVRRNLRDWLVTQSSAAPVPVEQQSLPPPAR